MCCEGSGGAKFGKEFANVYEIGVESELNVIGGGSDSNIFAKEDTIKL